VDGALSPLWTQKSDFTEPEGWASFLASLLMGLSSSNLGHQASPGPYIKDVRYAVVARSVHLVHAGANELRGEKNEAEF
jgi:hypothetical protein